MVSKKQVDNEVEVQIIIGAWCTVTKKKCILNKREEVYCFVSVIKATCNVSLEKVKNKFKAYHSDIADTNEDYLLLLESGEEAQFIQRSNPKEFFPFKQYREDLGKDYAKIGLFLRRRRMWQRKDESSGPKRKKRLLSNLKRSSLHVQMNQLRLWLYNYKCLMRKVWRTLLFLQLTFPVYRKPWGFCKCSASNA